MATSFFPSSTAVHPGNQNLSTTEQALEHKTAELAHSLALMQATLDSTTDAIFAVDKNFRLSAYNQNLVHMWQVPPDALQTHDQRELAKIVVPQVKDQEQFVARVEAIYETSPAETFDILELLDGRIIERFSKMQLIHGKNVGRVWTFRDITERRRAEAALHAHTRMLEKLNAAARQTAEEKQVLLANERAARAQAEQLSEIKDEFLSTLSHELRTPLSAVLGWSQLLRRDNLSEVDLKKGLDTIERNVRAQVKVMEDLLDMSRITSGKVLLDIQTVEPRSFIEAAIDTIRPAAQAKGIQLDVQIDADTSPISGDPARLQQAVWNLLSNAIKFTPEGGTVRCTLEHNSTHIDIIISDTGQGIRQGFLDHVFDRFRQADGSTTRRFGGLGIGLSIVKSLVELHGGSIHATSAGEGQGATFIMRLPRNRMLPLDAPLHAVQIPAGSALDNPPVFEKVNLSGLRVLVVDDEIDARELIERVLAECDAEVLSAGSAQQALSLVEAKRPDVLISDISMPEVDGYELLQRIRTLSPECGGTVPAIALTAFARPEDRTRALGAGFLVHMAKPVEPSELVATIANVIGRLGTKPTENS